MIRTKMKKEPDLIDRMLDQIDFKGLSQEEVLGQDGILKRLTGRLLQKILEASNLRFAMTEHLGYEKNSNAGDNSPYTWRAGTAGTDTGKRPCSWKTRRRSSRCPGTGREPSSR